MNQEAIAQRWEQYRIAQRNYPFARENELRKVFVLTDPKSGEKIWEVGTGHGFLTFPLAEAVGNSGEVITTDVHAGNTDSVLVKNKEKGLKIRPMLLAEGLPILEAEEYYDYFDTVTTLATFHHFDNRQSQTGESGRKRAIEAFHKNLKHGGRLVIADVLQDTISQKYFDAIDNPEHLYPTGHPHDFFSLQRLREVAQEYGFAEIQTEVLYVPWKFRSEEEASNFIHNLHNARCSEEESFNVAKTRLGFHKVGTRYELGWELFFLTARKA